MRFCHLIAISTTTIDMQYTIYTGTVITVVEFMALDAIALGSRNRMRWHKNI